MHVSSFEYVHAMLTLHQAGIKDADAITCLHTINQRTPNITYAEFLTELRTTLKGDTDEQTNRLLSDRFGSDAVRAARALQVRV